MQCDEQLQEHCSPNRFMHSGRDCTMEKWEPGRDTAELLSYQLNDATQCEAMHFFIIISITTR